MIYTTNDFNWLKNIVKNNQKLLKICNTKKKIIFFLGMYKMVDYSAEVWNKA